ncbi:MAG: hypothetical protein HC854_16560 [Flavobacterium sp.]|nr:hypothetical protein [Flavobacterium sp.]
MGNATLRTINCSTVAQIKAAMADARPGDEIIIAAGTYASDAKVKDGFGKFNYFSGLADGTAANPIIIRGASSTNLPILTVPTNLRYVSPIMGITGDYWVIKDLEISYGQKGLMLDTANNCKIINVTIHHTDQEGLHLRSNSSNNLVQNCKIFETGIGDGGTGEGVYVGSDEKKSYCLSSKL